MVPGTVFVAPLSQSRDLLWVVVDAKTEVELWTGSKAVFGDVMPARDFEVVSVPPNG